MTTYSCCYFEFSITCPTGYITPQQAVERLIAIGWVEPIVEYTPNETWRCVNRGAPGALLVQSRTFHVSPRGSLGINDGLIRLVDEYSFEAELKHEVLQ